MEDLAWKSLEELNHVYTGAQDQRQDCLLQRGHDDFLLLKDPSLYPRFNFALPKENKENFPLRGKLLLKPQHKLHCRSEFSL